ncbi:MAG: glycoside hydrolase family 3 C-terminal domain-containing protein [Ktedonobacterales bacterium]
MLSWETLPTPVAADSVSTTSHRQLRDSAYARTTTLVRDDAALLPLRPHPDARILVLAQPPASVTKAVDIVYQHEYLVEAMRTYHPNVRGVCLGAESTEDDIAAAIRSATDADMLVIATINAHLDGRQASLMRRLLATGRPVVGIAVCNPYDLAVFPELRTYLATYEYTQPALAAVAGALFGAFEPAGRLPVSLTTPVISSPPAEQP